MTKTNGKKFKGNRVFKCSKCGRRSKLKEFEESRRDNCVFYRCPMCGEEFQRFEKY